MHRTHCRHQTWSHRTRCPPGSQATISTPHLTDARAVLLSLPAQGPCVCDMAGLNMSARLRVGRSGSDPGGVAARGCRPTTRQGTVQQPGNDQTGEGVADRNELIDPSKVVERGLGKPAAPADWSSSGRSSVAARCPRFASSDTGLSQHHPPTLPPCTSPHIFIRPLRSL